MKIKDIFKPIGVPTVTYVNRDAGKFEKDLKDSIFSEGQLCLLTGSSKTGKTTLYKKVLKDIGFEEIVVRCNDQLKVSEFWKIALEQVDFSRIKQTEESKSITGKGEVKLGWKWLVGLIGEINLGISSSLSETQSREKVLSNPSPDHLIPILSKTNAILVIEDFHYLTPEVQKSIFQIWKAFVDNEISVLVIGTTNHAVDLAFSNKDLIGRISHIELTPWTKKDLSEIINKGFRHLGINLSKSIKTKITNESVGLPIITQQICLQLFFDNNIRLKKDIELPFKVTPKSLNKTIEKVAKSKYSQFEDMYSILANGIRKSRSKYNTYELILLIFSIDPIAFSLTKIELNDRINKLENIDKKPPQASINSTLTNLKKHQLKNDLELLEWLPKQQKLYIIEPAFLFYLRWRVNNSNNKSKTNNIFRIYFSELSDYSNNLTIIKDFNFG